MYVYGTLMAELELCGIELARKVHKITAHVTKNMGYRFDDETGTWSVMADDS